MLGGWTGPYGSTELSKLNGRGLRLQERTKQPGEAGGARLHLHLSSALNAFL